MSSEALTFSLFAISPANARPFIHKLCTIGDNPVFSANRTFPNLTPLTIRPITLCHWHFYQMEIEAKCGRGQWSLFQYRGGRFNELGYALSLAHFPCTTALPINSRTWSGCHHTPLASTIHLKYSLSDIWKIHKDTNLSMPIKLWRNSKHH